MQDWTNEWFIPDAEFLDKIGKFKEYIGKSGCDLDFSAVIYNWLANSFLKYHLKDGCKLTKCTQSELREKLTDTTLVDTCDFCYTYYIPFLTRGIIDFDLNFKIFYIYHNFISKIKNDEKKEYWKKQLSFAIGMGDGENVLKSEEFFAYYQTNCK